jgi:hypothetical protein
MNSKEKIDKKNITNSKIEMLKIIQLIILLDERTYCESVFHFYIIFILCYVFVFFSHLLSNIGVESLFIF